MDNLHAGYPVEIACYLILSTLLGQLLDCWHPIERAVGAA
jgi:hypothetical protein